MDEPVINRGSSGCCVPPLFFIGVRLFVLLEGHLGEVSSMPWRGWGTLVSWANCSVGVQSCPTPPRRPAARPDPTRPWYVWALDSTDDIQLANRLFIWKQLRLFVLQQNRSQQNTVAVPEDLCLANRPVGILSCTAWHEIMFVCVCKCLKIMLLFCK